MYTYYITLADTPSALEYDPLNSFRNIVPKKAYTFGINRELAYKAFFKEKPEKDPLIPGPGTYRIVSNIGKGGRVPTLKPKAKNLSRVNFFSRFS